MKRRVLILIVSLLVMVSGSISGQDCTITGPDATTIICIGESVNLSVSTTGTAPITYEWQYSSDGLTAWATVSDGTPSGITYSNGDSNTLTIQGDGTEAAGDGYYRCVVDASDCGPTNSSYALVTIVTDPTITAQPTATTTECIGAIINLSVTASDGTGSYSYQWYSNNVNNNSTGTLITGAVSSAYTIPSATAGTYYYYCIVKNTGVDCSSVTSDVATVNINPLSVGGTVSSDQLICFLTAPADLLLAGNTGSVVKWQKSTDAGFTAPTDIAVTSTTLTSAAIGILISDTYFRAVVKSGTCSETFSSAALVTVRPAPTAATISVNTSSVCKNSTSPVVTFTNPNASPVTITYNINGANQTTINVGALATATLNAPTTSAGTFVYVLKNVFYTDIPACLTVLSGTANITVNPLPVPTITGPSTSVRVTSEGNVYTTESGMGSTYTWAVSAGGELTSGGGTGTTNYTATYKWNATGPQTVSVTYTDANTCQGTTVFNTDVKPLPVASGVTILGTPEVGKLLVGSYTYTDGAGYDEGTSIYKWYRDVTNLISGANLQTYTPTSTDDGKTISFEVTPVSTSGIPNTGIAEKSAATAEVVSSGVPVASEVCIERTGLVLEGKYKYTYPEKAEGVSTYRWLRNGSVVIGTGKTYTLVENDTTNGALITFEVTPVSVTPHPKTGSAVESYPLARFTMAEDTYSEAIDAVTLEADPAGGVFSGQGVTNGVFSPNEVGDAITPYPIKYQVNIVNPHVTCSQVAYKNITVTPGTTTFGFVDDTICHNDAPFWITVETIPDGAEPYIYYYDFGGEGYDFGFFMNDYYWIGTNTTNSGIVTEEITSGPFVNGTTPQWRVLIDPSQLQPGNGRNILYLYYYFNGYYYLLQQPLNIESNVTVSRINNLAAQYCANDPIKEIAVDIMYPAYADAIWNGGAILSDSTKPVAKINPAAGIPGQTYTITYQYESQGGCRSNMLSQNVKINPLPDPSFTLDTYYNIDSGAVTLVPVLHPGGSFVGNGVSANKLFPDLAGTGSDIITYSIKDANLCYNELTKTTTIRKAIGTIDSLPPVVCYEDTTYIVTVNGMHKINYTVLDFTNTKKSIVYTPGDTTAYYNLVQAGSGLDTLIFSYIWDGVDYAITTVVNIDSIGDVLIKNLLPDDIVCSNRSPFELFAEPSGGIFTGPVTGGYLDPSKAMGYTSVSYKYTNNKSGCSATTNVPFKITPPPVISFNPADYCIEGISDTTLFINNTFSVDSVSLWHWEFIDPLGSTTSTKKHPSYLYTKGGFHTVSLNATSINNCTSGKVLTFDLGERPTADFYWKNDCYVTNDSLMLFDSSYSTSGIVSRSWDFFDGGPLHYSENTKYPKITTGYMPVRYIVNTSYANCSDTVLKRIYIRPTISLASDNYFEDFESGQGNWVKGDEIDNSWTFGTPDREVIKSAASGSNAWYTNFDITSHGKGTASLNSPCFDFTEAARPMIRIKLWKRFQENRDGAALQYKIGDDSDWEYVGSIDDGINWYNSSLIKGRPGGDQLGWTTITPDPAWTESKHSLDELKGKNNVKLRIDYGSDGTAQNNDGIAFDDISIEDRSRNVLIEHFTNTSSSDGSEATAIIDTIDVTFDKDVVNIQYHTNFPGFDPFYSLNPGDASARILFYGLTRSPYSIVDGGTRNDFASVYDYAVREGGKLVGIRSNDIIKRSLISPLFDIKLDSLVVSGGVLTIGGDIVSLEDITLSNLTLYLAVIEKTNYKYEGASGETLFRNVFRKFVPDAAGLSLDSKWTKGVSVPIQDQTWIIQKTLNSSDIEVVAFIQNNITKEVYQAVSMLKPKITVGIERPGVFDNIDFALYPNPAKQQLTIQFGEPLERNTDIFIYDFGGMIVKTFKAGSGETEFVIDDLGLKDGIYLIRVSSGGVNYGFKKLIISGS